MTKKQLNLVCTQCGVEAIFVVKTFRLPISKKGIRKLPHIVEHLLTTLLKYRDIKVCAADAWKSSCAYSWTVIPTMGKLRET